MDSISQVNETADSEMPKVPSEEINKPHYDRINDQPLPPREYKLFWPIVLFMIYINISAIYGIYRLFSGKCYLATYVFVVVAAHLYGLGITSGAHRLWSHRSYKAKLPVRIFLMIMNTSCFQESIFNWVRNHRLHHKYVDEDADPYNPKRGFFFSHVGWILVQRHPRSIEKGKQLDMSDLFNDPVVWFQKKYYAPLVTLFFFIVPVGIPMYFFNETFVNAWHLNALRWAFTFHGAMAINSVAHHRGFKPYDRRMGASDHPVCNMFSVGEGNHNYHHVFPWDYRSAELNTYYFNISTAFIDLMALLGLAYDLKSAPPKMVDSRAMKTGIPEHRPKKIK